MLAEVQADIERTQGSSFELIVAAREHGLLRDDAGRSDEAIPFYDARWRWRAPGQTPIPRR